VLHQPLPFIQLLSTALSMVKGRIFLGEEVCEMLTKTEGGLSPFL
jgi:hypothetical protein